MFESSLTLIAVSGMIIFLALPAVSNARIWRAIITPLASIIGSGFLVIGPILDHAYGGWAPLAMAALCALAYLFGMAIRQNIRDRMDDAPISPVAKFIETTSSWSLSLAYIVSVTYYLNLFGAFAVRLTPVDTPESARLITTALLLIVLAIGWRKGFAALERLEQASVTLKLAIIAGLIVGLGLYFGETASAGELIFNAPHHSIWQGITLLFGLIVTVQGFETSRYLGSEYDARTRIRSMQYAQWISTAIYMSYILLMAYTFRPDEISLNETAIIDLMDQVAPILPILLIAAALSAQFSAAIADTGGCGGLVDELTNHNVSAKQAYLLIAIVGIGLTWFADIFSIISYASRAFAAYYALQSGVAAARSWTKHRAPIKAAAYGTLAVLGIAILIFGQPVE